MSRHDELRRVSARIADLESNVRKKRVEAKDAIQRFEEAKSKLRDARLKFDILCDKARLEV